MAVAVPELRIADIEFNTRVIMTCLEELSARGCQLVLFPELCITGYSCADLFYQSLLLERSRLALQSIAQVADERKVASVVVGLPLEIDGRLYDCAAFIGGGEVLGIIPKTFLPTTNEFYEERWFTSAHHCTCQTLEVNGTTVRIGTNLLFAANNMSCCRIGIEICEDLWAVNPPSGNMALSGATLLLNLSASDELLGKADYRRELVKHQSARCLAAYLYSASGPGESTTDVVYSGHSLIAEDGVILAETNRFQFSTQTCIADIDLQRLTHERLRNSSFSAAGVPSSYRLIRFDIPESTIFPAERALLRPLSRTPFVPSDSTQRAKHCHEVFSIQSTGLAKRLRHTGIQRVSLGVSGGLDSTLALLVTVRAFDLLNLDRQGIVAVTMPGPGTTSRTRGNAEKLAGAFGASLRRIPIGEAVRQHFRDIGHDERVYDITYENTQARERTQILMDLANQVGGLTVGTGDLSELALGWCTYNADEMSMYHVNAGVPKTLVRYIIEWCAESEFKGEAANVLSDICVTPITPELLPLGEGETLQQKTEESIGPYILHDFFLFYTVRHLFAPRKVFYLTCAAFGDSYSAEQVLHWMKVFYQRFFTQQFKRSVMPDGPKVGSVALSPRGDWRMPSDASFSMWVREVEELEDEYRANH